VPLSFVTVTVVFSTQLLLLPVCAVSVDAGVNVTFQ
jgi:hypothetical protein